MDYIEQRLATHVRKLRKGKVAIFPFGMVGHQVYAVLQSSYNILPDTLVDNNSSEENVISLNDFIEKVYKNSTERYKIILATKDPGLFRNLLGNMLAGGISAKDIVMIYSDELLGSKAIEFIVNHLDSYKTVLDIGCGPGLQACVFESYGLDVTRISLTKDNNYVGNPDKLVLCDFMKYEGKPVDVVWASHVLEHIQAVPDFLERIKKYLNPDGCLAITVPNNEKKISYEHIHTFNAGRVLRYLLMSGYDCSDVKIKTYGYNLSVLLPHVKYIPQDDTNEGFKGSRRIFNYLPPEIVVHRSWTGDCFIWGDIEECNWNTYPTVRI